MATQEIADREFGQYQGIRFPAVKLTSGREAKFASKMGSFVWRKGIELGIFTFGAPTITIIESKALSIREKMLLNSYLTV